MQEKLEKYIDFVCVKELPEEGQPMEDWLKNAHDQWVVVEVCPLYRYELFVVV